MMRVIKTAALALLPLVVGGHAPALEDEPKVITLSCDGTLTPTYGANKTEVRQPLQKAGVTPAYSRVLLWSSHCPKRLLLRRLLDPEGRVPQASTL